jgi:hypothetical protein
MYKFLHNLLHVLVRIANKMGLQKKIGTEVPPDMLTVVITVPPLLHDKT